MPKGPLTGSRFRNNDLKTRSVVLFFGIASHITKLRRHKKKKRKIYIKNRSNRWRLQEGKRNRGQSPGRRRDTCPDAISSRRRRCCRRRLLESTAAFSSVPTRWHSPRKRVVQVHYTLPNRELINWFSYFKSKSFGCQVFQTRIDKSYYPRRQRFVIWIHITVGWMAVLTRHFLLLLDSGSIWSSHCNNKGKIIKRIYGTRVVMRLCRHHMFSRPIISTSHPGFKKKKKKRIELMPEGSRVHSCHFTLPRF